MRLDHLLSKERPAKRKDRKSQSLSESKVRRKSCMYCSVLRSAEGSGSRSFTPKIPCKQEREAGDRETFGGVAQLGEHLLCKQGVRSSILLISTTRGKKSEARGKKLQRL